MPVPASPAGIGHLVGAAALEARMPMGGGAPRTWPVLSFATTAVLAMLPAPVELTAEGRAPAAPAANASIELP